MSLAVILGVFHLAQTPEWPRYTTTEIMGGEACEVRRSELHNVRAICEGRAGWQTDFAGGLRDGIVALIRADGERSEWIVPQSVCQQHYRNCEWDTAHFDGTARWIGDPENPGAVMFRTELTRGGEPYGGIVTLIWLNAQDSVTCAPIYITFDDDGGLAETLYRDSARFTLSEGSSDCPVSPQYLSEPRGVHDW